MSQIYKRFISWNIFLRHTFGPMTKTTFLPKTFLINVRIVSLPVPRPAYAACSVCAAHQRRLTALVVDDALLRLLGVELAQRAVLWILLDVSLPGPHAHPAGHAAGGPADPLGHHARRRLCRRGDGRTKSAVTSRAAAAAWKSSCHTQPDSVSHEHGDVKQTSRK